MGQSKKAVTTAAILMLLSAGVGRAMSVSLTSSLASPQPVGTEPVFAATVTDADAGTLRYRFRIDDGAGAFRTVVDFGPNNTLQWGAVLHDGMRSIEVTARNVDTGETQTASLSFLFAPVATGTDPVVSSTVHPMVMLYSAPACESGSTMYVVMQSGASLIRTNSEACDGMHTMNFYLAGMQPGLTYSVRPVISSMVPEQRASVPGAAVSVTAPAFGGQTAAYMVVQAPLPAASNNSILLQSTLFENTVATDLAGDVVWYYPQSLTSLTRTGPHATFYGFAQDPTKDASGQVLRQFDLAGMTLRETNAARVSEQLAAMGMRPVDAFHHEVREMPGGGVLLLASGEQVLPRVQSPGPDYVLGDTIVVLDADLQVVWAWSTFDHLDITRRATLGETCAPVGGGCPPFYAGQLANDWTHCNAVSLMSDGSILLSSRHQDAIYKIDYANGAGSGDILWTLGQSGDFAIDSSDPLPWFSHQHDPHQISTAEGGPVIALFDNGNVRNAADPSANSRGQVLVLDENNRIAHLQRNFDLGAFSLALGTAQLLPNGDYHFDLGWLSDALGQSVELDPTGKVMYSMQVASPEYRSFRLTSLYDRADGQQ